MIQLNFIINHFCHWQKVQDEIKKTNIRKSCKKIIETNPAFSAAFNSLSDENKEWIRDYLSNGKGVIPYIKKSHEDLNFT